MGDFNEEVTKPPISTFFKELNMHNVLHTLFPSSYTSSSHTFNRGHSTIDAIFATQGLAATRGGYLPSHIFDSDHKTIWIDLQLHAVFGNKKLLQPPLNCRRLKNEDPRVVKKFNTLYHTLLLHHNLPQAISHLIQNHSVPLTHAQQQEFERIDQLRVRCILKAERHCRKLKTGNIEFSPTIQHQRNLIRFWKLILKRKQGQKIDTKYLTRWEKRLHITNSFSTPLSEVKHNLNSASKKYKLLKKEHSSLRDEWIEQLAAARAAAGKLDSATELHNLRQKEKIRNAHRQIRWCLQRDSITPPITTVTENTPTHDTWTISRNPHLETTNETPMIS